MNTLTKANLLFDCIIIMEYVVNIVIRLLEIMQARMLLF